METLWDKARHREADRDMRTENWACRGRHERGISRCNFNKKSNDTFSKDWWFGDLAVGAGDISLWAPGYSYSVLAKSHPGFFPGAAPQLCLRAAGPNLSPLQVSCYFCGCFNQAYVSYTHLPPREDMSSCRENNGIQTPPALSHQPHTHSSPSIGTEWGG